MGRASRDDNFVTTLLAVDITDVNLKTPVVLVADPVTNRLYTNTTVTGFVTTGIVNVAYDTILITSYNANGDPLVVEYLTGGAGGTVVATLTITYNGSNQITQVVRT